MAENKEITTLFVVEELKELLEKIGLLCSNYYFEHIIPDNDIRENITKFKESAVADILINSPELFVMPQNISGSREVRIERFKKQTFFIKILLGNRLKRKEYEIYEHFYGDINIVIFIIDDEKNMFINRLSYYKTKKHKDSVFINPTSNDELSRFIRNIDLDIDEDRLINLIQDFKTKIIGA